MPKVGGVAYLAPPGAITQLHQDAGGTMDSGHSVILGHNDVIMFRRLPIADLGPQEKLAEILKLSNDHKMKPHAEQSEPMAPNRWPTEAMIAELERLE